MNSKVISFAIQAHANVNHLYDGKPYSIHLSIVSYYCQKYIHNLPETCGYIVPTACWLHDTIEDCRLTYNDIKMEFGEQVADIVYAVSNEKGKNRKERANDKYYKGIIDTPYATYVKLCDRLANVKYSYDTGSRMFGVYQKENIDFIENLFPQGCDKHNIYRSMVEELILMLQ